MIQHDDVRHGRRVILAPFEGEPEQRGTILSDEVDNGTVLVSLDDQYLDGYVDDGLREVGLRQLTLE